MQFILHRIYYKDVSSVFCIPAHLPSDTNKACCAINTRNTLAGGNVVLPTTKASQNLLAGGDPIPPQVSMKLSEMGPSIFTWDQSSPKSHIIPEIKKTTHLVEEPYAQGVERESLATAACCVLVMWSILHVVKSSGKGGLEEASIREGLSAMWLQKLYLHY